MKEMIIHKEVWVPSMSPFRFKEQIDPKTGEKKFIMKGLMLPFNQVSRNAVLYNIDSIKEKYKGLIGKPVMYNHKVDSDMLPKGHFINSTIEDDGWYYEADIDPAEKDLIRKLQRQDLRHVSIQLIGGKVQERLNEANQTYTEAWVEDIIEGSIVPAPGFLDTTASFAEALHQSDIPTLPNIEDVSTSTGAGAMAPTKLVGQDDDTRETNLIVESDGLKLKHSEDPDENFDIDQLKAGIEVEKEHTDDEAIAKSIAKAHLAEFPNYYTALKKMEDELKAAKVESILSEMDMKEATQILKEFSLTVGEYVRIPFGVDTAQAYQGQIGKVVKIGTDSYTIEFEDGKKIKLDKEVFDISVVS